MMILATSGQAFLKYPDTGSYNSRTSIPILSGQVTSHNPVLRMYYIHSKEATK